MLADAQVKQSEAAAAAEASRTSLEAQQQQLRMVEAELQHLKAVSTRDAALLEEANRQSRDLSAKLQALEMVRLAVNVDSSGPALLLRSTGHRPLSTCQVALQIVHR